MIRDILGVIRKIITIIFTIIFISCGILLIGFILIASIKYNSIDVDVNTPLVTYENEEYINDPDSFNKRFTVFYEEKPPRSVLCADKLAASDTGLIAVVSTQYLSLWWGEKFLGRNVIYVFDSDGELQYGYYISTSWPIYIEWKGENLVVYFHRGDEVVELTPSGEIADVRRHDNSDYSRKYIQEVTYASEVQVGDKTYRLSQNIFDKSSMLIETNADGSERIMYDARVMHAMILISYVVIAGCCIFATVATIVRIKRKDFPIYIFGIRVNKKRT